MRACVVEQFGRPWVIRDRPVPAPGPGQVLIRVSASGFCGTDVHLHQGKIPAQAPIVAGHQPVGIVEQVGTGVTEVEAGDRVGVSWFQKGCDDCEHCLAGHPAYCERARTWINTGGGNAEYMIAWARGCTRIPPGLADELAAPMLCAGHTSLSALRRAEPRPGDRVAVIGFGALGHLALQFAHALGHETVVVTSSAEKIDHALGLGADAAVLAGDHIGDTLRHAGKADIVIACTNSAVDVGRVLTGLRPEGRLVNTGFLEGPITLDSFALTFAQRKVIGATVERREDLVDALEMAAAGQVRPMVDLYPLDDHEDVLTAAEAGKLRYTAVLLP